jgi:hypothetical protein
MDTLHATIEEFAADGYTHVKCYCSQRRIMRLRPIRWLPRISMGPTIAQLSARGEKPGNEAEDRKFHELHCGLSCQAAVPRHAYWIPKRAGMTMPA